MICINQWGWSRWNIRRQTIVTSVEWGGDIGPCVSVPGLIPPFPLAPICSLELEMVLPSLPPCAPIKVRGSRICWSTEWISSAEGASEAIMSTCGDERSFTHPWIWNVVLWMCLHGPDPIWFSYQSQRSRKGHVLRLHLRYMYLMMIG